MSNYMIKAGGHPFLIYAGFDSEGFFPEFLNHGPYNVIKSFDCKKMWLEYQKTHKGETGDNKGCNFGTWLCSLGYLSIMGAMNCTRLYIDPCGDLMLQDDPND